MLRERKSVSSCKPCYRVSLSITMFLVCQRFHRSSCFFLARLSSGFIRSPDKVVSHWQRFCITSIRFSGQFMFHRKVEFSQPRDFAWRVSCKVVIFSSLRKSLLWVEYFQDGFGVRSRSKGWRAVSAPNKACSRPLVGPAKKASPGEGLVPSKRLALPAAANASR